MVARRILVPPVRVRILPRQLKERAKSVDLALLFYLQYIISEEDGLIAKRTNCKKVG